MSSNFVQEATLGKPSLKARLEAYYSLISPETLNDSSAWRTKFNQIYQKFGGSYEGERKLASKLAKKYGTAVRLLVATDPIVQQTVETARRGEAKSQDQYVEDWYTLRRNEQGSGNLCFVSESFDPVAALIVPEADVLRQNPWISDCSRLDTVGQFALHLPLDDPQRKEATHSRKRPLRALKQPQKKNRQLSPFDAIAESIEEGPLARLHAFRRQRVRIIIRYVNAIRGVLTGVLIACDKHMNMILRDVEEEYSPRPTDRGSRSNTEQEVDRRKRTRNGDQDMDSEWAGKRRKMKQLLVRGDNIVLVSKASEERKVTQSRYRKKNPVKQTRG